MSNMKSIYFPSPVADDMVRAILEGRKTVTRRVVKLKYSNTHLEMFTNKYGTHLIEKQNEEPCQRRCDFVVFRQTGNVEKWRVKVCSLWIIILAVFARQV